MSRVPGARSERFLGVLALFVFFVSGFVALLYQVVWQRMLTLFSGADVYSVTIVVAAFMAGLGCGSLAGGALADRLSRSGSLFLFAAAEIAIALFAFGSKGFFYDFLYLKGSALAASPVRAALVLFVSLLAPTFAMGMSLPLLSRALTREVEAAAGTVGALYGMNTLGAAVGALFTTWWLLTRFGLEKSLAMGAAASLVSGLCVLFLAAVSFGRRGRENRQPGPQASSEIARGAVPGSFRFRTWLALYALSGFVALSLEILWFRLLGIMLKSTAFTFGTLLAIYLAGLALGTLLGTLLVARTRRPARSFLLLQAAVGLYVALSLAVFVGTLGPESEPTFLWQYFDGGEPLEIGAAKQAVLQSIAGTDLSPEAASLLRRFLFLYFLLPALLVGPPTLLMGASFPYLQKSVQRDLAFLGRRVGGLQAANIAGGLFGTVVTGWALLDRFGTAATLKLLVGLTGAFAILAIHRSREDRGRQPWLSWAVAGLLFFAAIAWMPDARTLWARLHGTQGDLILFVEDKSGLSLLKSGQADFAGPIFLYANGLAQSWIPYAGVHSLLGALPALLHPEPKEIAVIGLGSGDTLFHIGGSPDTQGITCIEIVGSQRRVLELLRERRPYPALARVLGDPRIRHAVGDGRTHILRGEKQYDLIEADPLRPSSAYSGNLYSYEYFALLRDSLKPGGLAASWSPTSRVHDTFVKAFPYVLSFGDVVFGSNGPIAYDKEAIRTRMAGESVQNYYALAGSGVIDLVSQFLDSHQPVLLGPDYDRSGLTDINSDLFPKDEFQLPRPSRSLPE